MLSFFAAAARLRSTARELYGAVVAQARAPFLYSSYGVPDTPEGRFELIAMHLCLVLERLNGEGAEGRKLVQAVTETFVTDMDDNMREMGVGDLAVPRKVKRAAAALYERAERYRSALAAGSGAEPLRLLAGELCLGSGAGPATVDRLAGYIRRVAELVARTPVEELLAGRLNLHVLSE